MQMSILTLMSKGGKHMDIEKQIENYGIVPLIVLEDVADAKPLGQALVDGGIPLAEVTFRTDAAAEIIKVMSSEVDGLIVGAGTVHNVEQAKLAVDNGATFIVTPGMNPSIVEWCLDNNIACVPGCVNPADIEYALSKGLKTLKFFPAEAYGGVKTLKALAGPYSAIKFMPTGGVSEKNMNEYLSLSNVCAIGGSFTTPADMVKNKDWAGITRKCKELTTATLNFQIEHVGINSENEQEAKNTVETLASLFNLPIIDHEACHFAGSMFEVMKNPFKGTNGHICITTSSVTRAMHYFSNKGIEFDIDSSTKYDKNGNIIVVYFKQEIGGFAFHLKQK